MTLPRASRRRSARRTLTAAITAAALTTGLAAAVSEPARADGGNAVDQLAVDVFTPALTIARDVLGSLPTGSWTGGAAAGSVSMVRPADGIGKPGIGIMKAYPIERHVINDRMELDVDNANGNVVLRYRDMTLKSLGIDVDVQHVYNNISTGQGTFGRGWSMSTGRDVGLEITSDKIVLHGPTAYTAEFTKSGDAYSTTSGIDAKLIKNSDGYQLKFDKTKEKWQFSDGGYLVSQTDKNDNKMSFFYNADRTLASIKDTTGRVTKMTQYDAGGRLIRFEDPTGAKYGPYQYDANANLTQFTDRGGKDVKLGYDDAGNLTKITEPRGAEYALGYDAQHRVTSLSEPTPDSNKPAVTKYMYGDKKTDVTDPLGGTSTLTFDDKGRQTEAKDQLGHKQSKTWTANSDVSSTTNSGGNSVTYEYDGANNMVSSKLPTGAKSAMGYTDANNPTLPTAYTDPEDRKLSMKYDDKGNVTTIRSDGLGKDLFTYTYNDNGTIKTSKDGDGRVTSFEYDDYGRLTKEQPPSPRPAMTYEYDTLGRVTSQTDGNGIKIGYKYDAFDRVVEIDRVDGNTVTPIQRQTYDADGNRTASAFMNTAISYAFDPRNQVTKVVTTRGGAADTVSYTYDPVENLLTLTDAGGKVTYGYDKAFRLTSTVDPSNKTTSFTYDDMDNRTSTAYPNGVTVRSNYDKSDRPTTLMATRSNGAKSIDRTYNWKKGDKDTSLLQNETDEGKAISYTYDALQRLTQAGSKSYSLDTASNLTSAEGRTFGLNAAGQATSMNGNPYTYDGAGNLLNGRELSNTYSQTNQLTSSALAGGLAKTNISYDTSDQTQRASVTNSVNGTNITQNLTNSAVGVTGVSTNGLVRDTYVRDPKGTLLGQLPSNGKPNQYAVTDYQGSVLQLTGADGSPTSTYGYSPYGVTTRTENQSSDSATRNPFKWQGQFQLSDAHGSYAQGSRYMDPQLARFTQPDFSKQDPNPYGLAFGNPIEYRDPSGNLSCTTKIFIGIAIPLLAASLNVVAGIALDLYFEGELTEEALKSAIKTTVYGFIAGPLGGFGAYLLC